MNISFFEEKPLLEELDFQSNILHRFKNIHIDELNNLLFYGPKIWNLIHYYAIVVDSNKRYNLNYKMTNKTKSLNIIVKNNKNIRLYSIKGLNGGKFFQILGVLIKS